MKLARKAGLVRSVSLRFKNNMSLKKNYFEEVESALKEQFGFSNALVAPRLTRVVINIGMGPSLKETGFKDLTVNTLTRITGQKPVETKGRKSIAGFKIRQGMTVGLKVTLRGKKMYDFVEKLINFTLPRVRDFRGLSPKSIDGQGNLTIGFDEHLAFPEVNPDEVERLHGLEVTVVTSAKSHDEGLALLKLLGFPFKSDNS